MLRIHVVFLLITMSAPLLAGTSFAQELIDSLANDSTAQDPPEVEDGWRSDRDTKPGIVIRSRELTFYPQPEPKPALRYRFLASHDEAVPGNAAIYYLKALGFLEQELAREKLAEFHRETAREYAESGRSDQVPPEVWLETPPKQLPLSEVHEYLRLTRFQPPLLADAARRTEFDMGRRLEDAESVIAYLLPEVQSMRQLARTQSIRFRVAVAENRIDDAIEILGQQFALAHHLEQDEFLVSNLVGIAIGGIAWNDALYLTEHPDAPNLYWAWATLPDPLVDLTASMAMERELLYKEVKVLREVDETPRSAAYWQDFIGRLAPQLRSLAYDFDIPIGDNTEVSKEALVLAIVASYPGARKSLEQEAGWSRERIEQYPTAQIVFLAMVKFYDRWRDEVFKWTHLPFWQVRERFQHETLDGQLDSESNKYGWMTTPTRMLLPAVISIKVAEARNQQTIALARAAEAIRDYAADHEGRLPSSLQELRLPAPLDPFTGRPLNYRMLEDGRALLEGHELPGIQYRLILKVHQQ